MISRLLCVLLLLLPSLLSAQLTLSGKLLIKNSENDPMAFAEVTLSSKGATIGNKITDDKGIFSIIVPQSGVYTLSAYYFKKKLFEKNIEVSGSKDLGVIEVDPGLNPDDVVTFRAKKKIIVLKEDRLVFNVGNSISASSGDAL